MGHGESELQTENGYHATPPEPTTYIALNAIRPTIQEYDDNAALTSTSNATSLVLQKTDVPSQLRFRGITSSLKTLSRSPALQATRNPTTAYPGRSVTALATGPQSSSFHYTPDMPVLPSNVVLLFACRLYL